MVKIAIVGYSQTRLQAPFSDPSWQIWGMNHRYKVYPRMDLHFELHSTKNYPDDCDYFNYISKNNNKSILTGSDPRFKNATIYPKDDIMDLYGNLFTCTAAWMIAYAIKQNPTDIAIYGIDCAFNEEYKYQRPSVLDKIRIIKENNINLYLPKECKLFIENKNCNDKTIDINNSKLYWDNIL